ncbi:MAG TPA: hypothetical protein VKM93_13490 [Terriglobia bacterium]|nr:hypothetical protein [Terriglobia bacterium]
MGSKGFKEMAALKNISVEELRALAGDVVDEKLREFLGDPDEGLALRPQVRKRLLKSLRQPKESRETVSAAEAARRLAMEF